MEQHPALPVDHVPAVSSINCTGYFRQRAGVQAGKSGARTLFDVRTAVRHGMRKDNLPNVERYQELSSSGSLKVFRDRMEAMRRQIVALDKKPATELASNRS